MSKYVKHKNGMTIGSSNVFFYKKNEDLHTFESIVSFEKYQFTQINTMNVFIQTPAQQLCFYPRLSDSFGLKSSIVSWLNKNIGIEHQDWGYSEGNDVFFKKRSQSLMFVRWINKILEGMKI